MISETNFPTRIQSSLKKKEFEPLNVSSLLLRSGEVKRPRLSPQEEQGFDNVAFDLEGLENVEPGSRKPLVGVHVRTMSAEEFVRSSLNTTSPRSRRMNWIGGTYPSYELPGWDSKYDVPLKTYSTPNTPLKCIARGSSNKVKIVKADYNTNVNKDNDIRSINAKNKQTTQGHLLNIICNKSLPSNFAKKEKTGGGSAQSGHEKLLPTSLTKTMVRVGGVCVENSPPFSQNLNVSAPFKVVISDSSSKSPASTTTLVSCRKSVLVDVGKNTPNVVITHSYPPPTASTTFAPSVVSALSKVSSVRIVPSPNNTPTPSIIGVSTTPLLSSSTPEVVPSLPLTTTSGTSSVKSSHSSRALEVVKRHINIIKNGGETSQSAPNGSRNSQSSRSGNDSQSNTFLGFFQGNKANRESTSVNNSTNNEGSSKPPAPPPPKPISRPTSDAPSEVSPGVSGAPQTDRESESPRREGRERRRERRERRRERRALRTVVAPLAPGVPNPATEIGHEPRVPPSHLPDLLNSHIPPPYNTMANGPRSLGGLLGPMSNMGGPPPMSLQMPPPPVPPLPPMGPYPPPAGGPHVTPIRAPIPDNPWTFFGSRRSRGSRRGGPSSYLGDEEAKSCCGLLVTQAVSIRWFIIMISFVGLCCTVVGTVLGAVKTNSSEYVTITLLMIGVGIVLITVSGVAWHLTSRDAPCRVMLGLAPNDSGRGEGRRFMSRMAPSFGRPHHPYAAMMYPEFQYRPPPPSYQASMQEYRLRLFLLDRHNTNTGPPQNYLVANNGPSPPPTYRSAPFQGRGTGPVAGTLSRESDYSRPPSYRSREGSITHNPDASPPSVDPSGGHGGGITPVHSRDPSYLSFLSREGSGRLRGNSNKGSSRVGTIKYPVVVDSAPIKRSPPGDPAPLKHPPADSDRPVTAKKAVDPPPSKDDNTVTIVQTTDCSRVIAPDSVIVTVSGSSDLSSTLRGSPPGGTEISVLAHL